MKTEIAKTYLAFCFLISCFVELFTRKFEAICFSCDLKPYFKTILLQVMITTKKTASNILFFWLIIEMKKKILFITAILMSLVLISSSENQDENKIKLCGQIKKRRQVLIDKIIK